MLHRTVVIRLVVHVHGGLIALDYVAVGADVGTVVGFLIFVDHGVEGTDGGEGAPFNFWRACIPSPKNEQPLQMIVGPPMLAGTLELTSKVRYGLTSRGVPIFRFIPYDKRFPAYAVGCSQRNLFYNVHAIVEPAQTQPQARPRKGELPRANLVKNLGPPTKESETEVLLVTYAHDSQKVEQPSLASEFVSLIKARDTPPGTTFHIDPPGCKDVDDTFTVHFNTKSRRWEIAINIADVAEYVQEGSVLDVLARRRATSFYSPTGQDMFSMLPSELANKVASLLPGQVKLTVSLCFEFDYATAEMSNPQFKLTTTTTHFSYTYDEAQQNLDSKEPMVEFLVLQRVAETLAPGAPPQSHSLLSPQQSHSLLSPQQRQPQQRPDTHQIVERLMVFYNSQAGKLLAEHRVGIHRRHKGPHVTAIQIEGVPEFLAYEAASYCLPGEGGHFGLGTDFYAYASSPIRRYADIVNQRAIKAILQGIVTNPSNTELIDDLNRRQKQAKAFSRDMFFMTRLSLGGPFVEGIVMEQGVKEGLVKTRLWVEAWRRVIVASHASMADASAASPGTLCKIQWYENREQPRWKERIVFKLYTVR